MFYFVKRRFCGGATDVQAADGARQQERPERPARAEEAQEALKRTVCAVRIACGQAKRPMRRASGSGHR
jgi:hypothetical protein